MNLRFRLVCLSLGLGAFMATSAAWGAFAQLDRPDATAGYLARLLINEVPFPGERSYESEANSQAAMLEILWVLHPSWLPADTGGRGSVEEHY